MALNLKLWLYCRLPVWYDLPFAPFHLDTSNTEPVRISDFHLSAGFSTCRAVHYALTVFVLDRSWSSSSYVPALFIIQ